MPVKPNPSQWREWVAKSQVMNLRWRRPQRVLIQALERGADFCVMPGGNGSGKTTGSYALGAGIALGVFPWVEPPADVLILGRSWDQVGRAMRKKALRFVEPWMIQSQSKFKGIPVYTKLWNGSELSVATYESGPDAIQGGRHDYILCDEPPPEDIIDEALYRFSEDSLQAPRIVIAATPTHGRDHIYTEWVQQRAEKDVVLIPFAVFENGEGACSWCGTDFGTWTDRLHRKGWTREFERSRQAAWTWYEQQCEATLKAMPADLEAGHCGRCWTYGVEPLLPQKQLYRLLKRTTDRKRLAMRLLGSYESLGGDDVFDEPKIEAMLEFATDPNQQQGPLGIWGGPRMGHSYSIGVDGSRGVGRDETVFTVLDNATGEVMAVWGDNETQYTDYFWEMVELGHSYHTAQLVPEWASSGEGIIPLLIAHQYPNLYTYVPPNQANPLGDGVKVGFVSGPRNRNRILMKLIEAIDNGLEPKADGSWKVELGREDACYVHDPKTVAQLARLFYNHEKDGKIQVPDRTHDDRILALALAWEGRCHPNTNRTAPDLSAAAADQLRRAFYDQERRKAETGPKMGRGLRRLG